MSDKKIVYLWWLDSALTPEWTRAPSEAIGLTEIETIGYLVFEDKREIQLAQSSYGEYKYSAIQAIPKSVILEKQVLQKPKKKT